MDWKITPLLVFHALIYSIAGSKFYRAAVYEHYLLRKNGQSSKQNVEQSLKMYHQAAETASKDGASIIIFPEGGLNPGLPSLRKMMLNYSTAEDIPDPKTSEFNPCSTPFLQHKYPILTKLSCSAKDNNIYVVANLVDVKYCQTAEVCHADRTDCEVNNNACSEDGMFFYNSNVVFDRKGTLIARYRKRHLYLEYGMNAPGYPVDVFFETDFGNFSTVVCFDLNFKEPIDAIEKTGIRNIAYPTYWFNHFPFYFFATANQQAWAIANNANLLASNGHVPSTGTLGSGIYSGKRGALIYTHNPDGRSKVLVSNVPSDPNNVDIDFDPDAKTFVLDNDDYLVMTYDEKTANIDTECKVVAKSRDGVVDTDHRCHSPTKSHYNFTKLDGNSGTVRACSNGFCCKVTYKTDEMMEEYYMGITGEPVNFYDVFFIGVEACFISRCNAIGDDSCMDYKLKSNTVFRRAEIVAEFKTPHVFPFAVDSALQLTKMEKWTFDGKSRIEYINEDKKSSLLFLGFLGRRFENDKILFP